jgi:hypothetical protein
MAAEKKEDSSTNKILRKLAISINDLEKAVEKISMQENIFLDGAPVSSGVVLSDGVDFWSLDYSDEEVETKVVGAKQ